MNNSTKDQNQLQLAAVKEPSWWDQLKALIWGSEAENTDGQESIGEDAKEQAVVDEADKKEADKAEKPDADIKEGKEKELTAEEANKMEETAAGVDSSGGADFTVITYGRYSEVTDQPQLIVLISSPINPPIFRIYPINFIPDFGTAPFAEDDGPFNVFERGLPQFGLPTRIGSNNDPNQDAGNKLLPDNITVNGNLLANDSLGVPGSFIAFVELNGGFYFPDGNGVITVSTAIGEMIVYTTSFMGFAAGDFSYTLEANAMHPWGEGINSITQNFTYTIVNTEGASTADFPVIVWDDIPTGYGDYYEVVKPPIPAYDILVVLDTSVSMLLPGFNGGGDSRLDIMKDALTSDGGILDGYANASSDLNINIINFAFFPDFYSATDLMDAKSHIDGLGTGLLTNYELALLAAEISLLANELNPAVNGFEKQVIFMSDGAPLGGYIPAGILTLAAWQATLALLNVDTDVIDVASPFPTSFLHLLPIARLGDLPEYLDGDLSNLSEFFPPIIPNLAQISGNFLDNDVLGADGLLDHLGPNGELGLYQIQFEFESEAAAEQYIIDNPGIVGASSSGGIVTIPIPNGSIPTPLGQTIAIDNLGNFLYTINSSSKDGASDFVTYFFLDDDGDPSHAVAELKTYIEPIPRVDCNIVFEAGLEPDGNLAGILPTVATGNLLVNDTLGTDPELVKVNYMGTDYYFTNGYVKFGTDEWTITIYDDGDYQFDLINPLSVPGHGPNVVLEEFTYTVTNITGVENDAVLTIKIVDDIPVAVHDATRSVIEGGKGAIGNVMDNDLQGADQPVYLNSFTYKDGLLSTDTIHFNSPAYQEVTVTTYTGGSLTVANDGFWEYRPPSWVFNLFGLPIPDGFSYTIIDNDLDTSSAEQIILIEDRGVFLQDDDFGKKSDVYERGLADGSDPGGWPLSFSANVLDNDSLGNDPGAILNPITHVTYNGVDYSPNILGIINISTGFFEFSMDARNGLLGQTAGDFTFTLTDNVMHAPVQGFNPYAIDFTYHYEDIDGSMGQATLHMRIIDDVPIAKADAYQIDIPAPASSSYSLIFMIDTHYVRGLFNPGSTANQTAMMASVNALIGEYANLGDLSIQIIGYDSTAHISSVMTDPGVAMDYVDGLPLSSSFFDTTVNYNLAILDSDDGAIFAMDRVQADNNIIYLLTDGRTTFFNPLLGPFITTEAQWDNAVSNYGYTAYIAKIGNNPDPGNRLDSLDNSGVFTSLSDLENTYENHPPSGGGDPVESSIMGNVLTNDIPGADNPIHVNELQTSVGNYGFGSAADFVVIVFADGSTLDFHADGNFTFTVDDNATARTESMLYSVIDTDGDISKFTTFDIQVGGGAAPLLLQGAGVQVADPYIELHLVGSDSNGYHLTNAHDNVNALHMQAGGLTTEFVIDMDEPSLPQSVDIENLGTNQQNVLTFDDVVDINSDNHIDILDVVKSVTQAAPEGPVEVTLQNDTTLVLHNIGTIAGNDVQSLDQHLQQVAQAVNVQP